MSVAELLEIFSVCRHQVNLCAEEKSLRARICDRPSIGRPSGAPMILLIVRKPLEIFTIHTHHIDVIESFFLGPSMQSELRREKTMGSF